MSRGRLAGTKAAHRVQSDREMQTAKRHLDAALKAIERGSCTSAYTNIAEMWEAIGRSEANGRWAGQTAWSPHTELTELGYQFSQRCLRDVPVALSGARSRRKKR